MNCLTKESIKNQMSTVYQCSAKAVILWHSH